MGRPGLHRVCNCPANHEKHGSDLALRLLHFADLHLDRSFAAQRLHGVAAQRRREDLRAALVRIVERAQHEHVDLITCAGDLFEHESVTRETSDFILDTLGRADRPVLIAPGHRDPAQPSSPYRYLRWPSNVTIASHEELRPYSFGPVQVWTAGFARPDVPESPLRGFVRLEGGPHLLLLHASDMASLPEGTLPCAPITGSQVEEAGFLHALLGHYHDAQTTSQLTYPGSPEPLGWDESGRHCVALATISDDGRMTVDLQDINQRRFVQEALDVTGMTSREHVRDALLALRESKRLEAAIVRVTLVGERSRGLDLDPQALTLECRDGFGHLEFSDRTHRSHDLEAIATEFTSRGELVRQLTQHQPAETAQTVRQAIQLALDSFDA